MPNHEFKRALEEVRELCSLRMSEAWGRRDFHNREACRLPNGRKREEHGTAIDIADKLAGAYREIIERIDLHLPKSQLKAALKAAEETLEKYGETPEPQGGDNG